MADNQAGNQATRQADWQTGGKAMHFMIEYSEQPRGRADFYV